MALKAGYVGIKSQLMQSLRDKLLKLDGIIPAGASSDNPLATESDINDLWDANAETGAHNLLPNNAASGSSNNVSWVVNEDKSITITTSGTASGDVTIWVAGTGWGYANAPKNVFKKGVQYDLTDGNGDATSETYFLAMSVIKPDGTDILDPNTSQGTTGVYSPKFTVPDIDDLGYLCYIRVKSGATINKTIKPMVSLASDPNKTYSPFAMTNQQLTAGRIRKKVVSDTTSANGNINTGLDPAKYVVLSAFISPLYISETMHYPVAEPACWNSSYWSVHVRDADASNAVIANQAVDCTIWYAELDAAIAALTRSAEDPADEPAATTKTTRSKKTKEE